MLKERNLCECCLTNCKDKETGARCYRKTGFRRHRLLRLVVQQEVTLAERTERKGEQSRNRAVGADRLPRDAPPEKFRRLDDGEGQRGLPTGARTRGTAAASTRCQSWTGRATVSGSEPGA